MVDLSLSALLLFAAVCNARYNTHSVPEPFKDIIQKADIIESELEDEQGAAQQQQGAAGVVAVASPSPSPVGYLPLEGTNAKFYQPVLGEAPILEVTRTIRAGDRVSLECMISDLPIITKFCDGPEEPTAEEGKQVRLNLVNQENKVLMGAAMAAVKKGDKLDVCAIFPPRSAADKKAAEEAGEPAEYERDAPADDDSYHKWLHMAPNLNLGDLEGKLAAPRVQMGDKKTGWNDCVGCGTETAVYCCKAAKSFGLHQGDCEGGDGAAL